MADSTGCHSFSFEYGGATCIINLSPTPELRGRSDGFNVVVAVGGHSRAFGFTSIDPWETARRACGDALDMFVRAGVTVSGGSGTLLSELNRQAFGEV